jgi:hypothetical protein
MMKNTAATLSLLAITFSGAVSADDQITETFNPVKDRLEAAGELENVKSSKVLNSFCDQLQDADKQSGGQLVTANNDQLLHTVYICNAIGHEYFEKPVYNVEILNNLDKYSITEQEFAQLIDEFTTNAIQNDCVGLMQMKTEQGDEPLPEKAEEAYAELAPLCRAYDRNLP